MRDSKRDRREMRVRGISFDVNIFALGWVLPILVVEQEPGYINWHWIWLRLQFQACALL